MTSNRLLHAGSAEVIVIIIIHDITAEHYCKCCIHVNFDHVMRFSSALMSSDEYWHKHPSAGDDRRSVHDSTSSSVHWMFCTWYCTVSKVLCSLTEERTLCLMRRKTLRLHIKPEEAMYNNLRRTRKHIMQFYA